MILSAVITIIGFVLASILIFSPRFAKSTQWQATVTPLASIMGSGFLVSAPLLSGVVGQYAVFFMGALLILAYLVGSALRFNIQYFEPIENEKGFIQDVAFLSRVVLAGAYFISITYYLQLLGAFVLNVLGVNNMFISNVITTALLCVIGLVGMWRGLNILEKVEKYAIGLNLGMIGALICALIYFNLNLLSSGLWVLPKIESKIDFHSIKVILGLLIVVQGFETSRFLGEEYTAKERISSMKKAQGLSAIIYLIFISLVTVLFTPGLGTDVTAIIEMVRPIAVVLPLLLIVAAVVSQFSASVADNAGASGLVQEITRHRIPTKLIYALILFITVLLTWTTNVNQIIAYASRAFALFYALQCSVSFLIAKKKGSPAESVGKKELKHPVFNI